MRRLSCLLAFLGAAALSAAPPKPDPKTNGPNLIPNGNFEAGTDTPTGWQTVDGLTTFWVRDADPRHGKCIKFDTDVLQSQGYEWWGRFARAEGLRAALTIWGYPWWGEMVPQPLARDAPKKLPTVEPKYDTIAGNDGVWLWSDYIPVEKGKAYWFTLDAKGAGMMAWLVGYPGKAPVAFGSEAKALQGYLRELTLPRREPMKRGHESIIARYIWRGQMGVGGSGGWRTFSRKDKLFRPTSVTPQVRYVRVLILPFWPPGEYFVDNVRLVEVPDPERPKSDDE